MNPAHRITRIEQFASIAAMPAQVRALLEQPGRGLFASSLWFESFVSAGLPSGATPAFIVIFEADGVAHGVLPCQRLGAGSAGDPDAAGLTSFYSCDFAPILTARNDPALAFAIGRAATASLKDAALIRFDSMDAAAPWLPGFLKGLESPGRALLRYQHFGRWWEPVGTAGFAQYMARRDGALRETVRRKGARLARMGGTLEVTPAAEIERGIADYEAVYARSWKGPEPFPEFQPLLMRNLAKAGWLRLAICHLDGKPIAAQLWVSTGGVGAVLKLAHDQAYDGLSPGTVLTAFAIRRLIEDDGIATLDFGRGDDGYKRAWTTHRAQHVGVLSASIARRPLTIARHWGRRSTAGGREAVRIVFRR